MDPIASAYALLQDDESFLLLTAAPPLKAHTSKRACERPHALHPLPTSYCGTAALSSFVYSREAAFFRLITH